VLERESTRRIGGIDALGLRTGAVGRGGAQQELLSQLVSAYDYLSTTEGKAFSLDQVAEHLDGDARVLLYQWAQSFGGKLSVLYLPLRQDSRLLGLYILFVSNDEPAPAEGMRLLQRLIDLAALRLAWLLKPAQLRHEPQQTTSTEIPVAESHPPIFETGPLTEEKSNSNSNAPALSSPESRDIWSKVEADLDGSDLAAIRDENLLPIVEELLRDAFSISPGSKVYLSHFADETHLYYLASLNETDWQHFRNREIGAIMPTEWRPCPFADELPNSFRSLAGEFMTRTEGENDRLRSIVWRLPRVSKKPERERRLNILGIDDQEVIRELLTNIIRRMGHRIVTVSSGSEALAELQRDPYDIVIAEAELPDLSGWELTRRIKAGNPEVKAIVLSGWEAVPEESNAGGHNADFVLTKPFKMEQLTEMISSACSQIGS
jgi:CheY-like chemotaxis protein